MLADLRRSQIGLEPKKHSVDLLVCDGGPGQTVDLLVCDGGPGQIGDTQRTEESVDFLLRVLLSLYFFFGSRLPAAPDKRRHVRRMY